MLYSNPTCYHPNAECVWMNRRKSKKGVAEYNVHKWTKRVSLILFKPQKNKNHTPPTSLNLSFYPENIGASKYNVEKDKNKFFILFHGIHTFYTLI